jgi:type I restriction enzyme, R subunit
VETTQPESFQRLTKTHGAALNRQPMGLNQDGSYKLPPMDAVGSGSVQEKQRAYLNEIIQKVNGLFEGELTDDNQLVYVNGALILLCH